MLPDRFGRYLVLSCLGRGGMAEVYLAQDPNMYRKVALKALMPGFLHDPAFQERFDREVRIISRLEHPAIIPVYDCGQDHGRPFLVMRYMQNGTLRDRLDQGTLSLDETLTIIRRICDALAEAHRNNIIHRDIKPGNILFDKDSNAYLSDFGIARLVENTQTATLIGSPQYMSPEQALGEPLNKQTDLYQLGLVLYEMLTGKPAYDGPSPAAVLYQHAYAPIPNPCEINPFLPKEAILIINRALAKDRTARFQTVNDFKKTLTLLTSDTGGGAPPLAPVPIHPLESRKSGPRENNKRKHIAWKRIIIGIGLLIILSTAGILFSIMNKDTIMSSASQASRTPEDISALVQNTPVVSTKTKSENTMMTRTMTATPAPTRTNTITKPSPTLTPSPTSSKTPTLASTNTPSPSPSRTVTTTTTPTHSPTVTFTAAPKTESPTLSATAIPTETPTPTETAIAIEQQPAVSNEIQSGNYYLFSSAQRWNRDTGLWKAGFNVYDLVGLNFITFIETESDNLFWVFDYDYEHQGGTQCYSPDGAFELVNHPAGEHYRSLVQFRLDQKGEQGFIYEWDPHVNFMLLWCLDSFFIVDLSDGGLYRGNYGESVYPWYIGTPSSWNWRIGRAW
ncbi:MAG: serine/threonine protein kinase [Anaerolineales bacterium]|nr:serine/threonine protein kinase [Anaerolineales bacterium]